MGTRIIRVGALALAVALTACSSDAATPSATTTLDTQTPASEPAATTADTAEAADTVPATDAPADTEPPVTEPALAAASFEVYPGTEQVALVGAEPGTEISLLDAEGTETEAGTVDEQGALLFRSIAPGTGYVLRSATEQSDPFDVADPSDVPDPQLYTDQPLLPAGGFGYIVTRDGTTLSANVVLPGPPEGGPYPTVVEYSGYQPSDPTSATFAQIYTTMGFAYVGVNMRGTGCSGGSYRFFETVQSLDGYDAIEAVAAQPWVANHEVGMVGISQLFVAATQPPSLAAITPLSVLDDSYRSTLYPGGLLNTGFAVEWTQQRIDSAEPYGQGWTKDRADAGDEQCERNQELRLQNPDLVGEIADNPFYTNPLGDSLAPITFVDQIDVPVFIAGAWQDEQTGGHFPVMLPAFTGSPHVYATLTNGLHTESLMPGVFQRYAEFLQLYVAHEVPDMTAVNAIVPVLGTTISGVGTFPAYESRFAGMTYDDALATFESEPAVRVNFEEGAADGLTPGAPFPRFTEEYASWPVPEAVDTELYLGGGGTLSTEPDDTGVASSDDYVADPTALPDTFYEGDGNGIWQATATYDWQPLPDGTGLGFVTEPMADDTALVGSSSVDLWISASLDGVAVDDTDLEVTLSEVRPDGTEVYVQSGWLRASQRALDEERSTADRPVQTHAEDDVAPLSDEDLTPVRVEVFPVAHVFRAGSRLRLTIDAPGNNRPVWVFDTIAAGETVTIAHDADHPSKVVLPLIAGIDAPAGAPACGSLRGQPCRSYVAAANGG